jgi:hypothetical protein
MPLTAAQFIEPVSIAPKSALDELQDEDCQPGHIQAPLSPTFTSSQAVTRASSEEAEADHHLSEACISSEPHASLDDYAPGNLNYETALNVLVSLGNSDITTATRFPGDSELSFASPIGPSLQDSHLSQNEANWLAKIFPTCLPPVQDEVVQLVRHYRYNIAPWVRTPFPLYSTYSAVVAKPSSWISGTQRRPVVFVYAALLWTRFQY